MHSFTYHVPGTLAEAIARMEADPSHGRFLAGGTDLYLALEHGGAEVRTVIDLKGVPGLDVIAETPTGGWRIGALARMAEIEHHPGLLRAFPALCAAAAVVGGPPVRNRATVGGNLCNASPAADTATPLLALGATVIVTDARGERSLPLADLWVGPRSTTLPPGTVLTAIALPAPPERAGNAFARVTRSAMDIAVVNAAAALALDAKGRLAALTVTLGAVAPTVIAVAGLGQALRGQAPDEAALDAVRREAEQAARPIDDVRASAVYRKEMAGVLARRAVAEALRHARGESR
jgi:carbon-monoxide dehydrogenase medium subunit